MERSGQTQVHSIVSGATGCFFAADAPSGNVPARTTNKKFFIVTLKETKKIGSPQCYLLSPVATGKTLLGTGKTSKIACHDDLLRSHLYQNEPVHWEPTDQFGNLYIGTCEAFDVEDLREPLSSMLEELRQRTEGEIRLTVDLEYSEINGPDPEQVSHILRTTWFETQMEAGRAPDHIYEAVNDLVSQLASEQGIMGVVVRLA